MQQEFLFKHVTANWISFLFQGYEGSLIKLTSKQVRHCLTSEPAFFLKVFNVSVSVCICMNLKHGAICCSIIVQIQSHAKYLDFFFFFLSLLLRRGQKSTLMFRFKLYVFRQLKFWSLIDLSSLFQPVGFVTFDSRSGAEAAKNALNVRNQPSVSNGLNY